MLDVFLFILSLLVVGSIAYYAGKQDNQQALKHVTLKLKVTEAVQHNLNCEVHDLRHEVGILKPDAAAYNVSKGLWCTDMPHIIKHHARKECFFRLGYPEQRL